MFFFKPIDLMLQMLILSSYEKTIMPKRLRLLIKYDTEWKKERYMDNLSRGQQKSPTEKCMETCTELQVQIEVKKKKKVTSKCDRNGQFLFNA